MLLYVVPPPNAAIVILFPVSLKVIFDPAVNVTSVDPLVFELITDVVAVPAPTVNEPSFVALASASFAL